MEKRRQKILRIAYHFLDIFLEQGLLNVHFLLWHIHFDLNSASPDSQCRPLHLHRCLGYSSLPAASQLLDHSNSRWRGHGSCMLKKEHSKLVLHRDYETLSKFPQSIVAHWATRKSILEHQGYPQWKIWGIFTQRPAYNHMQFIPPFIWYKVEEVSLF